ncbi:hypothetical protein [Leptolyngbya ohadii]|uniref:hypothetical protein n=1 Tax=Leptolyngbya ohadii TaxID=1962290 RepID=UPI0015C63CF4|nr:hypothetical protein [Leptolyngbya ohadii]
MSSFNLQHKPPVHQRSNPQLTTNRLSWYDVPETVKQQLMLVSAHWDQPELANGYMAQALALADDHPDVLVSAYRYFFYTHNNDLALQVTTRVLDKVRQTELLPEDWTVLKPILLDRLEDPQIRLYINAYAASGLILARLGETELARRIAVRVSEIETRNEFGGNVVRDILDHPDDDEEDTEANIQGNSQRNEMANGSDRNRAGEP